MGASENMDCFQIFNRHDHSWAAAGTGVVDNSFNNDKGHIHFRAMNIGGFGRTHVNLFLYFFMLSCLCLAPCDVCSFSESTTKK